MRRRNAQPALDLIAESAQGVAFLTALAEWLGTPLHSDQTGATEGARLYRVYGSISRGVLVEADPRPDAADQHTHRWGFYCEPSGEDGLVVVAGLDAYRRHSPLSGLKHRESSRRMDTFTLTFGPIVGSPRAVAGVPWREVARLLGKAHADVDVTDRGLATSPAAGRDLSVIYAKEGRDGRDFWRLDAGGHAVPLTAAAAEALIAEGATVRYVASTARTVA